MGRQNKRERHDHGEGGLRQLAVEVGARHIEGGARARIHTPDVDPCSGTGRDGWVHRCGLIARPLLGPKIDEMLIEIDRKLLEEEGARRCQARGWFEGKYVYTRNTVHNPNAMDKFLAKLHGQYPQTGNTISISVVGVTVNGKKRRARPTAGLVFEASDLDFYRDVSVVREAAHDARLVEGPKRPPRDINVGFMDIRAYHIEDVHRANSLVERLKCLGAALVGISGEVGAVEYVAPPPHPYV